MADYSHLWNDMSFAERQRLMPFELECQIRHVKGVRRMVVKAHKQLLTDIDYLVGNLEQNLERASSQSDTVTRPSDAAERAN